MENKQIQKTNPNQIFNKVNDLLIKSMPQISKVLPKHLNAERLSRIALTELRKNQSLLECEPISFIKAIMQAAQLGIEPGSELGLCYLVPYYNGKTRQKECQFILGYRGMIQLVRNSKELVSIYANCVYEGEEFEIEYGINEKLKHVPIITGSSISDLKGVYSFAKLKENGYQFNFIDMYKLKIIKDEQLNKIKNEDYRKYSPWATNFEEMAKKTAIRRLFKYLPLSIEVQKAIAIDESYERGEQQSSLLNEEFGFLDDLSNSFDSVDKINNDKISGVIENMGEK